MPMSVSVTGLMVPLGTNVMPLNVPVPGKAASHVHAALAVTHVKMSWLVMA